ncbi:hypothetical protein NAT51_10575 [Flavobacterium amniphilum]|uniref:hypothetical protein n=1 Tax=Flavobacterium amniphilum TaxID=1834035 RepID=UPI00202ABAC1|nr:hypothetical protein [Flavobacterium amniphilum]MCL9805970.1 hypothetical protein [Flavobacterium amniphilum]
MRSFFVNHGDYDFCVCGACLFYDGDVFFHDHDVHVLLWVYGYGGGELYSLKVQLNKS